MSNLKQLDWAFSESRREKPEAETRTIAPGEKISKLPSRYWEPTGTLADGITTWSSRPRTLQDG